MPPPTPQERVQRNRAILEQTPTNHLARFGLANALFDAGDLAEAESQFRQCLAAQPGWMAVTISLGRCLVLRGSYKEALGMLAEARALAAQQGHTSPLEEIAELEARCR